MKSFSEFKSSMSEAYHNGSADELITILNATYNYYEWDLTKGPRYLRLVRKTKGNDMSTSAVGFIDKQTGVIYKSAGWKQRSNTVIGNLNDVDTFVKNLPNKVYVG